MSNRWQSSPTGIYLLWLKAESPSLTELTDEDGRALATRLWARLSDSDRRWARDVSKAVRKSHDLPGALAGVEITLAALSASGAARRGGPEESGWRTYQA